MKTTLSDFEVDVFGTLAFSKENVKECFSLILEDIKKENSTNPDTNAVIIRGSVIEIIKRRTGLI